MRAKAPSARNRRGAIGEGSSRRPEKRKLGVPPPRQSTIRADRHRRVNAPTA